VVVGINANMTGWTGSAAGSRIDEVVSQTGAHWAREELLWSDVEPQRGVFDFSRYDQFMVLAARRGLHVLALLDGTPTWAGAALRALPSSPADYGAYVAAVVGRYGPHGSLWAAHADLREFAVGIFELWNEPYFADLGGGAYDPARYAEMVRAAALAGRAADPDARFLLAAEVTGRMVHSRWVSWIDSLYSAMPGLNRYFDGVAIHPYGADLTGLSGIGSNQLRRTELLRAGFEAHGADDKPLWITEVGWPTCTTGSERCTTDAGQAASLTQLIDYLRTTWSSFVRAVFVYHYEDFGDNPADPEDDYGLTTVSHRPKPALAIFQALAAGSA
jgi:hypothetical protein